jgi:hypothetical protein
MGGGDRRGSMGIDGEDRSSTGPSETLGFISFSARLACKNFDKTESTLQSPQGIKHQEPTRGFVAAS